MSNKEYEHGYRMGYEWAKYENGNPKYVFKELRSRGISMRTTYAVAFKQGATDAKNAKLPKYGC